jgi:hypothetical protein
MNAWGLIFCLQKDDGSDSFAVQLADETHWNDLVIIIAVVCDLYLTFAMCISPLMCSICYLQLLTHSFVALGQFKAKGNK